MEPITSLLDAFIKLADRIINLEKSKLQDKQTLFNEIVKPLFEEVEPVALNYIDFFRKARQAISKNPRKNLSKVSQTIREDRDAMLMARIKVRAMADQIKEHIKDEEIVEFAVAVTDFFYEASDSPFIMNLGSLANSLVTYIDQVTNDSDSHKAIDPLNGYIDVIVSILEKSWSSIVKSYEKIKIYSVSSPKLVQKLQTKKTKP